MLSRGEFEKLKYDVEITKVVEAPLAKGLVVGKLKIILDEKVLSEVNLISLVDVDRGSVFKRMMGWYLSKSNKDWYLENGILKE